MQVLRAADGYFCFAFYGEVGAGKTTFIKALCKVLGTTDTVASPTFALVNEYGASGAAAKGRKKIYHLDLYRLKSVEEAEDIGLDDYLADDRAWIFIEWPEVAGNLLPEKIVAIFISGNADKSRTVRIALP